MVRFKSSAFSAIYTGIDPTGRRGFMRCPVTALSPEELRAWMAIDPLTVSKYVHTESLAMVAFKFPQQDNEPGKPVPTLKDAGKRK